MGKPFQKILLTTDLSENSWAALPLAVQIAEKFGAELVIGTVVGEPHYLSLLDSDSAGTVMQILKETRPQVEERIREKIEKAGLTISWRTEVFESRHPADEICRRAQDESFDLIVMATSGHTGLAHALLGSTVERVVRTSEVPVLTVHGEE